MRPSGEKATETTQSECPAEGAQFAPARHVPELDGLSSAARGQDALPSGEKATEFDTNLECPLRVRSSRPLATSQSLIVLSLLPEASMRPSGEKATELTQSDAR